MLKNTNNSYGSVSKFLHWFMGLSLICLIIVGYFLEDLKMPELYKAHKAIGFLMLLLVSARLLWRFGNLTPTYDNSIPKWMAFAGHSLHYVLYALMIVTPLSAFIASNAAQYPVSFLFLFDMPSLFANKDVELAKSAMWIHRQVALILALAIGAHALAALYHHFIRKDNILKRMLPFARIKD